MIKKKSKKIKCKTCQGEGKIKYFYIPNMNTITFMTVTKPNPPCEIYLETCTDCEGKGLVK